ncbi:MAG: glycosyltransferase family 2 protein, partial [Anaerolineae bacterium]|nr:glycosyltransferase family 2 protein [Phycisphaerae bacterium]
MVDVLIQTFNEEENLPHTLASLTGWVNRVFIVDSGSTDRTKQIATEFGATVVHHDWEGYAAQKNWALDNLPFESPWVLILDADESVSTDLRAEITSLVSRTPDSVPEAGYYINRVFIFMGREIRHCGYFPSWNLRLFKRGKARYEQRMVHEHMLVSGPTGYLKNLLLHEDRRGLEHFFAKHNRYSTLEAREIFESPEPWPGLRRFASDRVVRRRFLKSRVLPYMPLPWTGRLI